MPKGVNTKIIEFLRECHKKMSDIFDNSLNIPIEIEIKYEQKGVKVKKEWESYLEYKFLYLLLCDQTKQNSEMPDKQIIQILSDRKKIYLKEFMPEWKKNKEREKTAYYYRISQLPWKAVHRRWYLERVDDCFRWCDKHRRELLEIDKRALGKRWYDNLKEIYKDIGRQPYADFSQERVLSLICMNILQGFEEKINEVHSSLATGTLNLGTLTREIPLKCQAVLQEIQDKFEGVTIEKAMEECRAFKSSLLDDFLPKLSLHLVQALYDVGFDETEVISQFLLKIKEKFMCEVCDFLDVSEDDKRVLWRVATVNHKDLSPEYRKLGEENPEALRKAIQSRESYGNGIGISGSILLQDADIGRNIWFHIGSNDVEHDPRQSKEHKTAYEQDLYSGVLRANKKINNFWMFPIFKRGKLLGAFRVVNKLIEEEKLQPGGWPYYTRVQLSLVAQWFSKFLETAEPQIKMREDFLDFMERSKQLDLMIEKLKLNWIEKEKLQAFLRHLIGDLAKKVEDRPIGCCIIITNVREDEMPLKEFGFYPLLDPVKEDITVSYDNLNIYHDIVDPLKGAYIFDQNGRFRRIAKLAHKYRNEVRYGYEAIKSITKQYPETLCLLLTRDAKIIQVYDKGDRVVEIFSSEGTGKWHFRYPQGILETMTSCAPSCKKNILKIICEACLELSLKGHGALIVVGDVPEEKFDFAGLPKSLRVKSEIVLSIDPSILVEFAKVDGAVFIGNNGYVTRFGTIVEPKEIVSRVPLFPGKGGRHETGETISIIAPKAMVIIVSQNRSISIVADGGKFCAKYL